MEVDVDLVLWYGMKHVLRDSGLDCSEIAEDAWRYSGQRGSIWTISRKSGFSFNDKMSGLKEFFVPGDSERVVYHTVFVFDGFVYCVFLPDLYMDYAKYKKALQVLNERVDLFWFKEGIGV
jgi:hypothetical protein